MMCLFTCSIVQSKPSPYSVKSAKRRRNIKTLFPSKPAEVFVEAADGKYASYRNRASGCVGINGARAQQMSVHRLLELLNNRKISFCAVGRGGRAVKKKDVLRNVTVAWDLQLVSVYVCPGETEPRKI